VKTKNYLLLILLFLSLKIMAETISGEIIYSGSSTGTIVIAVFTNPLLDDEPTYTEILNQPGNYSIENVTDGTYYLVSIMSNDLQQITATDPYGFWGTLDNLTPVIISSNSVNGINITLTDGTIENPNPFAQFYTEPDTVIQLPEVTMEGVSPSMVYDGTSIYLYKHNYHGSDSAKIYFINPESGAIENTYFLSLQSLPNKISWIDKMVFRNGNLWATGGYGDPLGSGYIPGFFKVDINSSTSSFQMPYSQSMQFTNGLACDGNNFFIGVADSSMFRGIVKFNPDNVSAIPENLFINLDNRAEYLSFGDNFLWVGIDKVNMFNPVTGDFIGTLDLPGSAAELYFEGKFWTYDEGHNTINVYNLSTVGVYDNKNLTFPENFSLSQNYPNPFNPSTTIEFTLPISAAVSIKLFNSLGEEIEEIVHQVFLTGTQKINFNGENLPSGVYFYSIRAISPDGVNFVSTKKMILVK
jgi:hypothetical protein